MSIKFNDFNFEVIDINTQGAAELTVNKTTLSFSQRLVEDMGNPPFIRTMIDPEKKIFAVQCCKQTDVNCVKFSKPKGEQKGGVKIVSTSIMRVLKTLMEDSWDNNHRYKISAKIISDAKAAVFYLETATTLELYDVKQMKAKTE